MRAQTGAVLDATGNANGIFASPTSNLPEAYSSPQINCPAGKPMKGLTITGLTIINAQVNGILLANVNDFRIDNVTVIGSGDIQYGIFPICCNNGKVTRCTVTNTNDAGIYVGDSSNVSVQCCVAHDDAIGIEVENSTNCDVQNSQTFNNGIGILCVLNPALPVKHNSKILVANNNIYNNTAIRANPDYDNDNPTVEVPPISSTYWASRLWKRAFCGCK